MASWLYTALSIAAALLLPVVTILWLERMRKRDLEQDQQQQPAPGDC
jgi:hypothetical protein